MSNEYPLPAIAGEVVVWRVSPGGSWFSPTGPERGEDYMHTTRGRVIPDGATVLFGGAKYKYCAYRSELPEGDLPEEILVSDLLMNGDRLEIVSVPHAR